jgi:hypothetical protein
MKMKRTFDAEKAYMYVCMRNYGDIPPCVRPPPSTPYPSQLIMDKKEYIIISSWYVLNVEGGI